MAFEFQTLRTPAAKNSLINGTPLTYSTSALLNVADPFKKVGALISGTAAREYRCVVCGRELEIKE